MAVRQDLTGKKYGDLKVLGPAADRVNSYGQAVPHWKCRCKCGREGESSSGNLRNPKRHPSCRSCGSKKSPENRGRKKFPSRLTAEDLQAIENGTANVKEMTVKYGVSTFLVYRWIKEAGIKISLGRPAGRIPDAAKILQAVEGRLNSDWSMKDLAAFLGVCNFYAHLIWVVAVWCGNPKAMRKKAASTAKMFAMRELGKSGQEIADAFGISKERVFQLLAWYAGYRVRPMIFRNWQENS